MLTRAVLSTMGVQESNFFSEMSDARTFAFSAQTTLGMVLDDPTDVNQLSKKLTFHFQKATAASMTYEYTPRTTFLTSMNMPTLKRLAKSSRYETYIGHLTLCIAICFLTMESTLEPPGFGHSSSSYMYLTLTTTTMF